MGTSFLTEDELVRWFRAAKPSHLEFRAGDVGDGPVSVRRLVRLYLEEGAREGVAADIAFVQALHETAWFNFPNHGCVRPWHNNFAGMGAVDGCNDMDPSPVLEFPSTRAGVRAQLQHLRAYVDASTNLEGTNLGSALVSDVDDKYPARWRWVRRNLNKHRYWEQFGGGVWASDPNYWSKIRSHYGNALVYNGYPSHAAASTPWYIKNTNRGGGADLVGYLGRRQHDRFLACDWNGDGRETPGVFRSGTWIVSSAPNGGGPLTIFSYGRGTDIPICGDWNRNGRDTPGIVRDGQWHLRNSLSGGPGQISFAYGRVTRGDIPLVGDWNRDGRDTPGIVRDGQWHLRNSHTGGPGQISFTYGRVTRGDIPLVGDWNRDGVSTAAVVR
jgi:hypothetical protein